MSVPALNRIRPGRWGIPNTALWIARLPTGSWRISVQYGIGASCIGDTQLWLEANRLRGAPFPDRRSAVRAYAAAAAISPPPEYVAPIRLERQHPGSSFLVAGTHGLYVRRKVDNPNSGWRICIPGYGTQDVATLAAARHAIPEILKRRPQLLKRT